jgi:cytochrome P450
VDTEVRAPTSERFGSMLELGNAEPWEYYESLRSLGDVVWDEGYGAWLVLSYDLVKQITREDDTTWDLTFRVRENRPAPYGLTDEEWGWFFSFGSERFMAIAEGDVHHLAHRWMMKAFTPKVLRTWRETLFRPVVHEILDGFIEDGHAELGKQVADLLAPRVIAAAMGLPQDQEWLDAVDEKVLRRFVVKQNTGKAALPPGLKEDAFAATDELVEMLMPYVDARRDGVGNDLISMVWREADDALGGPGWTEVDVIGLVAALWEGGSHSTRNSTSNLMYLLATEPGIFEALRNGGEKAIPNFVEEALRLFGPVLFRPRIALRDTRVGDVDVRAGDAVLTLMNSAARDADHYPCPHALDLERPAPRDHLAFFFGPHTCPGQSLARAELEEATIGMVERLDDLRLDPDREPPILEGVMARRWNPLHVQFTPGASRSEA